MNHSFSEIQTFQLNTNLNFRLIIDEILFLKWDDPPSGWFENAVEPWFDSAKMITTTLVGAEKINLHLGGGNSNIFGIFTPKLGEDEPILTGIFFNWVVQPPARYPWQNGIKHQFWGIFFK